MRDRNYDSVVMTIVPETNGHYALFGLVNPAGSIETWRRPVIAWQVTVMELSDDYLATRKHSDHVFDRFDSTWDAIVSTGELGLPMSTEETGNQFIGIFPPTVEPGAIATATRMWAEHQKESG